MPDESKVTTPEPSVRLPFQTVWAVRVVAMENLSALVVVCDVRTRSSCFASRTANPGAPGAVSGLLYSRLVWDES
ncbi:hypothetical protein GCM10009801_59520 [Streptomyces albiaxialis]|uniref:Uncharacterized protein n=1 Tax=Streptomyces albiaxialis TaxID=329523 RepID=A0ABN2WI02_9ACTN